MKEPATLSVRELTPARWGDFQRLFHKSGEWGVCWCTYYQRARPRDGANRTLTPGRRAELNRKEKQALVEEGRSHGILVYAGGEPVGWCQYGPKEELPRVDGGRKYRKLDLPDTDGRLWRITCFCVDRRHRGKGVATAGLRGALASIARRGGGVVEAYPVTHRGALASWFGSVSMFEREGFAIFAPFGKSNVLMRKMVRPAPGSVRT